MKRLKKPFLKLRSVLIGLSLPLLASGQHAGQTYGGMQNEEAARLFLDGDGSLLISGSTRSFGKGSDDFYLIKLSQDGEVLFQRAYGGEHHDICRSVTGNHTGGYALFGEKWDGGYGREDAFLLLVNTAGEVTHQQYYGGDHTDQGFSVRQTSDGFLLAGYTASLEGSTRGNFLLIKTDQEGSTRWKNDFGSEFIDYGFDVLETPDKQVFIAGTRGGFFNYARADFANRDADILLIRTSSEGVETGRFVFGGPRHDWVRQMVSDDHFLYLAGSSQDPGQGSFDVYVSQVDFSGRLQWEKRIGGDDFDYGEAIDIAPDGSLLICGTTRSDTPDGEPDILVIRLNPSGDILWKKTIPHPGQDTGTDLIALPDSGCLILGTIDTGTIFKKNMAIFRMDRNGELTSVFSGIQDTAIQAVKLFPNPFHDFLSIDLSNSPETGELHLQLFDAAGKPVYSQKLSARALHFLNLNTLPGGIYYYVIQNGDQRLSGKIVKN